MMTSSSSSSSLTSRTSTASRTRQTRASTPTPLWDHRTSKPDLRGGSSPPRRHSIPVNTDSTCSTLLSSPPPTSPTPSPRSRTSTRHCR
ncbi:hypothetical protein CORC01_13575 [Colletotrichum orchidophilum]|uniref:Uncharacterized protein n=1 Tax=Colletotrichum orchidophilum TaxID=1209926 RepID=A0A1G4APL0_9PEZI|nr:uncharacterized protein CORC01_13575 [Colletotrichum orchidophilum]OHE91128.1 hypothetical protein CORC01_13575 [Colletotrichum orchidophilum]